MFIRLNSLSLDNKANEQGKYHPRRPRTVSGGQEKVQTGEKKIRAKKSQERREELFSSFLTFLRPNFLLALLDFFPPPTNCPWVSEDGQMYQANVSTQEYFSCKEYRFFFLKKKMQ